MNKLLVLALPAVLAGSAAAQNAVYVLPGALPYPIAPVTLPSPVATYPVPLRIELPSPRLTPGQTLILAPAPASAAALPSLPLPMIPSRPRVPVVRAVPERENVRHPLAGIVPGLRVQLAEKKKAVSDELFDGRRAPVRPEVVVGLPERELEAEIGVTPASEEDSSLNY